MQDLSAQLARVARDIALVLQRGGHRAWIVGGAPRDLCLAREPIEIDMASDARPDEVEALFPHTIPVGRAFGTVVIHGGGLDVQHTTFRSEEGYSDARRPDAVSFGKSVAEDSTRRDFTCNALYLDPLTDEFLDPQHGLDDLSAHRLACVGDPRRRFEEDGLRLLRMARFAAALELEPGEDVLSAARAAAETLRGVSPERILAELTTIFERPHSARALGLLHTCGLLQRAIPRAWGAGPGAGGEAAWRRTQCVFEVLPSPPGPTLGLAALLEPGRAADSGPEGLSPDERDAAALEIASTLRASRAVQSRLREIWKLVRAIEEASTRAGSPARSERLRWMQSPAFEEALALARARAVVDQKSSAAVEELGREWRELDADDLHPAALIESADLSAAGIPRGPLWGRLLREVETLQLDRKLGSRADALAWIAEQVARDQEGGNTPRKK